MPRPRIVGDLRTQHSLIIRCVCGNRVELSRAELEAKRGIEFQTELRALSRMFRCSRCGHRREFRITVANYEELGQLGAVELVITPGRI